MERKIDPIWRNSMNFGAIGGIVMSLFRFFTYLGDSTFNNISNLNFLILIILIVIGTRNLRENIQGGQIKYSRAVRSGLLISIFAGIIFGFYVMIEYTYVEPKLMDEFITLTEESWKNNPLLKDNQFKNMIDALKENASPMRFGFAEIINVSILGLIFSLIISIFLKKEDFTGQFNQNTEQ